MSTKRRKKNRDASSEKCVYGAPFFAYQEKGARYGVSQGCCNHWDCPRCGQMVARQHYGRIVEGARQLVGNGTKLAFLTVTCRGIELPASVAFANYLEWTNRLIDAMRAKQTRVTKKNPNPPMWAYCQVTEKQQRSHPHSHFLTSFMPDDTLLGIVKKWKSEASGMVMKWTPALRSDWLEERVKSAGLGEQYDISEVETVEGASRYVAKYMFKESQFSSKFPKHWKRVRYSETWPKLAKQQTNAFVLLSLEDWGRLGSLAAVVDTDTGDAEVMARRYLEPQGVIVSVKVKKVDISPI